MAFLPQDPFDIELTTDANKAAIHIQGNVHGVASGDTPIDLWQAQELDASLATYPFSTSAATWSISSDNAGDTQNIRILRLIADYQIDVITVTLNGTTSVPLSGNTLRVIAMKNDGSTDLIGNVYLFEGTAVTAGVPTTIGDLRGFIDIERGANTMQQAITTIPAGFTAYRTQVLIGLSRDNMTGTSDREAEMHAGIAPEGKVFRDTVRFSLHNKAGVIVIPTNPWEEIGEKTDLKLTVDAVTGTSSAISGAISLVLTTDDAADITILRSF